MSAARFILKNPKSENDTLIFFIYRVRNDSFKFSLGEKINPQHWNPNTQRPKFPETTDKELLSRLKYIDYRISLFNAKALEIENNCKYQKITLTIDHVKAEIEKEFRPVIEERPKVTFFEFVEEYIANVKFAKESNPPRPINPRTIAKYKTGLMHLKEFARIKRKGKLNFSDINKALYDDFVAYLQTEKNQANNTIGKNINILLMFAREAQNAGFIKDASKFSGLKGFRESVFNVYLTEDELNHIYSFDFKKDSALDRMRDFFVLGCRTALRYSDYTRIKKENFYFDDEKEYLKIRTIKTRQEVIIPVHWQVREIMQKYDNRLPRPISVQKANDYIKTIGQRCGLTQAIVKTKTKGGHIIETVSEKCQMMTTHTARRTGATLMFKAGFRATSIMKITGHTTEASFMKYIKLDLQEHAAIMAKDGYFKKQDHLK